MSEQSPPRKRLKRPETFEEWCGFVVGAGLTLAVLMLVAIVAIKAAVWIWGW